MILRRISEQVKEQNWFAIGVELVILVLGVFIGIQVSNWNDERRDRALERQYIERLHGETIQSLVDLAGAADWADTRIATQQVVLGALRKKSLDAEQRNDFDSGLLLLGYLNFPRPRWTTVDELRSTGNMTILRDVELRELIGRTQAEFERREGISLKLDDGINAIRDRISNRFEVVEYDTASERAIKLNYDFPALAADTEFLNLVSQVDFLARLQSVIVEGQIRDIELLRDELAARLGKQETSALP